jgi:hypothetical protein
MLLKMVMLSILKVTVYPSLHSFPTESNDLFTIARKTCTTESDSLSSGTSNEAVWVESVVAPLGSLTLTGLIDFVLLWQGALIRKKFHVPLVHYCSVIML